MSKQMTPCEKLGYKVGDKFKVVDGTGVHYAVGSFITLIHDDGSSCPRFNGVHAIFESGDSFFPLDFVEKVAKLKPAKQALADAIHQNGGWGRVAAFASQDKDATICFFNCSTPIREGDKWVCSDGARYAGSIYPKVKSTSNWHQTILSRDEYFTAYPEQVKVEVNNETEHKIEFEMESESEVTIKVRDWHKSGELPPVGEVCEAYIDYPPQWVETEIVAHKDGFAIGWCKSVMKGCYGDKANEFRPLRTEREKAIDEMVDCLSSRLANCEEIAAHLYENGYRKEVK